MNETAVPVARLEEILRAWRNGYENLNVGIDELARTSGVTVRRVRAIVRAHVDEVDYWTADKILVAVANLTATSLAWFGPLDDIRRAALREHEERDEVRDEMAVAA